MNHRVVMVFTFILLILRTGQHDFFTKVPLVVHFGARRSPVGRSRGRAYNAHGLATQFPAANL